MEKNYNIPYSKITVLGENAIKPYWYYRNGLIHIRYTVDRAIKLSDAEVAKLKVAMTSANDKQEALAKAWSFFANTACYPIIEDGIAEIDKRIEDVKNGSKSRG